MPVFAEEKPAEDKVEVKKEFHDTGELWRETTFRNGKEEGPQTLYFRSGKVLMKSIYRAGELDGDCIQYWENGLVLRSEHFEDGRLEGMCIEYYESGAFKNSCVYRNGRIVEGTLNGTVEIDKRYSDGIGRDCTVTQYKDGLRHGTEYCFYEDQGFPKEEYYMHLKRIVPYVNNLVNGTVINYSPGGNVLSEIPCVNGKKHGEEKWYFIDGSIKRSSTWESGIQHGRETENYVNGKPNRTAEWKLGKKDGEEIFYDQQGNVTRKVIWVMGVEQGVKSNKDASSKEGAAADPKPNTVAQPVELVELGTATYKN